MHLTDIRVSKDRYTNKKILTGAPRTVCTIDPQTEAGREMAIFVAHRLPDGETLAYILQQNDRFDRNSTDIIFIFEMFILFFFYKLQKSIAVKAKKLATVAALHHFVTNLELGCEEQVLLRCFVTSFPLEASRIIFWKW